MTEHVIDKPNTSATSRMSAQEVEQLTQPLYERSLAEMKAQWHDKFKQQAEFQRQAISRKPK